MKKEKIRIPKENYVGFKINKLTILEKTTLDKPVKNKDKSIRVAAYRCLCECGKEVVTQTYSIEAQNTKSCGCSSVAGLEIGRTSPAVRRAIEATRLNKASKRLGEVIGRLTIMGVTTPIRATGRVGILVTCACSCGNVKTFRSYQRAKKMVRPSCGCWEKEALREIAVNRMNNVIRGKWTHTTRDGRQIRMRSSWELMFAEILDSRGVDWEYEPECFPLGGRRSYTPDFRVGDQYYEVKGWKRERCLQRIEELRSAGIKLEIIDREFLDREHPLTTRRYYYLKTRR